MFLYLVDEVKSEADASANSKREAGCSFLSNWAMQAKSMNLAKFFFFFSYRCW